MTDLARIWRDAWPPALAAWSRYTRLHDARLCETNAEAAREGLSGSFAMIRLVDKSVVINLEQVRRIGLEDYGVEILAHEIGHHVLSPGSATDHFRLLARIRRGLPTLERHAAMVANLYADLFINDRLQRQANLRMADIYAKIYAQRQSGADPLWMLYMGIYEELWRLDKGSLGGPVGDARVEGDAWLGARLVRVYANDWMFAAGRFAALILPYLVDKVQPSQALGRLLDMQSAAEGCDPSGLQRIEGDEAEGAVHPSEDARITGTEVRDGDGDEDGLGDTEASGDRAAGQMREPFEYGEILRAAGLKLSEEDIAIRYYRERALPHLVAFPTRPSPHSPEPQMEGLESWDLGDPLDEIDWLATAAVSPVVIPGLTTVRRLWGIDPGVANKREPVDLDIYVDSSGSMPDPRRSTSFLTLAGAIVALSALRAGSRVQVCLWSGKNQFMTTDGFIRDEKAILGILVGFYGGATAFPIHRLRTTYANRAKTARAVHILMISDDGITTMFDADELGNSGWEVSGRALRAGRAGGTMALNLWRGWDQDAALVRAHGEQGWDIHAIAKMEDLVDFARAFSRRHYAMDKAA